MISIDFQRFLVYSNAYKDLLRDMNAVLHKTPANLPSLRNNNFVWYGHEMAKKQQDWLHVISPEDILELETAAKNFLATGKDICSATKTDFPLPNFSKKLDQYNSELTKGRGFFVLRGLPVEKYSEDFAGTIFYAIGSYIGKARSQNSLGHIIGHIRDQGLSSKDPNVRLYQTAERQFFHTDSIDVVALLCMHVAKSGGESLIVSSETIFNEMLKTRPDLVELLMQPIASDRRGEVPAGELPYYMVPVFNYHEGYLSTLYQRLYIESAQRFEGVPKLSPKQIEALDLFDKLSEELSFSMMLQVGDMQFVYNHSLLHDRMGYEDYPEFERKRHLLRMWLTIPEDRPLPEIYKSRFGGSLEVGNRGGIITPITTKLKVEWS